MVLVSTLLGMMIPFDDLTNGMKAPEIDDTAFVL